MVADPKLSLAEQLASFPPQPPEKRALLEEMLARNPRNKDIPANPDIRHLRGVLSDDEAKRMLLYIDYGRGHITEEEFLAKGGRW